MSSQGSKVSEDSKYYSKYLKKKFINWSGNEQIDDFIQEIQLKIKDRHDIVLEWIPYDQFEKIKEKSINSFVTVYSAIWKDGPLHKNWLKNKYTRDTNKEVILNCLYYSQHLIEFLINEIKKYVSDYINKRKVHTKLYGISQNPNTKDYILVQNNSINFINWICGNEKVDDFIQEIQLKIKEHHDIVFEWIPYNQFFEIKEISKNGSMPVYSAIWNNDPLHNDWWNSVYVRDSIKEVTLSCLHGSQNPFESLVNKVEESSAKGFGSEIYGISQNPNTNDYILVQNYFTWSSENEEIDDFIQEMQLKIKDHYDIVFEWIPYNQFIEIKETGKNDFMTVYSAIWKNGSLHYRYGSYKRDSNKEIALKCLHYSQNPVESIIDEVKRHLTKKSNNFSEIYGISQNPDTNYYILVQNYFTWTSGNKEIDDFIQEMQLKTNNLNIVFEWIPYNQFNEIKETGKNSLITLYSAIWKDGSLHYQYGRYKRDSNKEIVLKCLHNSQNPVESIINEVKNHLKKQPPHNFFEIYGISQNPDTNDYTLVQNYFTWTSGNEEIDDFIQEIELKTNNPDIVFEWIPYNQFDEIKETGKNGYTTVYSAIWKDGPLHYHYGRYKRDPNKEIILKCLHSNSQNPVESIINEVEKHLIINSHHEFFEIYGISQNPSTNDYILIQNNFINLINWISDNVKIDDFIQEMELITNNPNIVFEWIPYNQFDKIKETGKNKFMTVYSAKWKDGPLHFHYGKYKRDSNKEVTLKYFYCNSQNPVEFLISEIIKYCEFLKIYGISQNPVTNDYILVQSHFTWPSKNEKIYNFIQEMQLKIEDHHEIVFEWIPYNQFKEINKETGNNVSITLYSAIWKNGPLHYQHGRYKRDSEIILKCFHNLQNPVESIINEVKRHLSDLTIKSPYNFFDIYGISQNPDTNDYILVQNDVIWTSENEKIDDFIQKMQLETNNLDIVFEWIPYSQFNEINETGKNGFMTVYSAIWKNGPLYYQHGRYIRDPNKEIALKCLHNSQDQVESLLNEVKRHLTKKSSHNFFEIYGISQKPDTNDYILVQNDFIWTSENDKIDDFIQKMQLETNNLDIVFEWIPYSQFNEINETGKNGLMTVYSAIWKNGPLHYQHGRYKRDLEVILKYLHNSSQNPVESILNEVKRHLTKKSPHNFFEIYGISQKPDTNDYILVQNDVIWTSENEKIDDFIQKMQLETNNLDIVFEWIPYSQFNEINETGKNGLMTVYSAIWKNGPLYYQHGRYKRDLEVILKYLHNSQNPVESIINEVKRHLTIKSSHNFFEIYGISQKPDTNDYILVQNDVSWTSENEKIDDFIQKMQLETNNLDIVFEWIPFSQFDEINETEKNNLMTVYSAIWKNGPLYYQLGRYIRDPNKEIALKCLHNSQDQVESLLNEVKKHLATKHEILIIYGISQNPNTNDYILVQNNIIDWISSNEMIDEFIQELQLKPKILI
ncbi:hypothetical protein RirG_022090 [Rhizophagus irregularis DAOM 197198w]|uniref:Protein kinase domain-containing protein n=2 Tax=Rhizophagus irregularis TaxID=588596 RepID=A0A015KDJ3_RHIIW|nr:hypothetical protein RirG_022090 [Rhizophagus irregularis DAOM 197198w]